VIIYAGAIMVLFVFVMMMLNLGREAAKAERQLSRPAAFLGPGILSALLAVCFVYMLAQGDGAVAGHTEVSPKAVGISMFSTYLLGVEMAGMLLLAGLIGAFHLGRRRDRHEYESEETAPEETAGQSPVGS
jgi:NADH-quinone oxidoreductase subunit J